MCDCTVKDIEKLESVFKSRLNWNDYEKTESGLTKIILDYHLEKYKDVWEALAKL